MKLFLFIFCFSISYVYTQQVSKSIPFGNKTQESGWNLKEIDGDFLISFSTRCKIDEDIPSEFCCAMIRVNKAGEVIWKNLMEFETNNYSRPGGVRSLLIQNDSAVVSGLVKKHDTLFLRLFIINSNGGLLSQKDYYFPFFNWNCGILKIQNGYLIYNILRDTLNPKNVFQVLKLDNEFKIVKELKFGNPKRVGRNGAGVVLADQSVLLSFDEFSLDGLTSDVYVVKLDKDLSLAWEKEIITLPTDVFQSTPIIQQESDSSIYLAYIKSFKKYFDTFNINITIYKFDDSFNSIWVKPYRVRRDIYFYSSFFIGKDNDLHIAGGILKNSAYNTGWIDKLNENGNMIWSKVIIDSSQRDIDQYINDVIQTKDGGYAIAGSIRDTFPNNDPSDSNYNIWFVTLDSSGCFNGDCNDTLILNHKFTTSINNQKLGLIELEKFYPNPAIDHINLSFIDSSLRIIRIYNSLGVQLKSIQLNTTATRIGLEDLIPGSYFVQIIGKTNSSLTIPLKVIR